MKNNKLRKILSVVSILAILLTCFTFPTSADPEPLSEDTKIVGGMVLSKRVDATIDPDVYKITLGAYSTGEAFTIKTEISRPVDIVLIIDESGSMDFDFSDNQSRWKATQSAINKFIDNVKADADKYNVSHRIAVTTYAGDSYIYIGKNSWKYSNVNSSTTTDYSSYVTISGKSNSTYYSMEENSLLEKVDGEYIPVKIERSGTMGNRIYTYTFNDKSQVVSNGANTVPSFGTKALYTYGTSSIVKSALQDVTDPVQLNNLQRTIGNPAKGISSAINPGGGTYPSGAADLANQIFNAHKADYNNKDKRGKIVIFFTDGMPGDGDSFSGTEAGKALTQFKALKDQGATVYSVGVFPEAVCTNPQTLPTNSGNDNKANRFMFLCSSYYPSATTMTSTGPIVGEYEDRPYYMSPQDAAALDKTFTVISDQIHYEYTEVVLTEKAMIKDVITPYFAGPADKTEITAYYQECTGIDPKDDRLRTFSDTHIAATDLTIDLISFDDKSEGDAAVIGETPNDTVIATNFNYKANWCGMDDDTPRGKKVVLEFYVKTRDGFLGGNGVPTNQAISGLYDDEGRLLPDFDLPMPEPQDVPIKDFTIKVNSAAKHVYLYGDLSEADLMVDSTIQMFDTEGVEQGILKLDTPNYGLAEWKVDFIDVTATAPKAPLNNIVADTSYNIQGTVSPKTEGTSISKSDTSNDTDILVYVPRITFKDSSVSFGKTPDYTDNYVKVEWVHKNKEGKWVTAPKMTGAEPKLSFAYNPAAGAIYDDSHVKITNVYIDSDGDGNTDTDITSYCLFDHETCDVQDCDFNDSKENFVVHVTDKRANIVIKNTGDTVDANDTFVYTITSANDPSYKQTVVIKGTGTATVLDLPCGKYTVTQDEGWSYNYECKTNPQEKTLIGEQITGRNNVFTFENAKGESNNIREAWDYVKNLFKPSGVVSSN